MGNIKPFEPVKLFFGLLYSTDTLLDTVIEKIKKAFGDIDYCAKDIVFEHTHYYEKEMGNKLKRAFVSIKEMIRVETMCECKIKSNAIEQLFCLNQQRQVNIDPGILMLHNVILLSTKNFSHRIPLQNGIYAELTLLYDKQHHTYRGLPWSYPDYQSKAYVDVLLKVRDLFYGQITHHRKELAAEV